MRHMFAADQMCQQHAGEDSRREEIKAAMYFYRRNGAELDRHDQHGYHEYIEHRPFAKHHQHRRIPMPNPIFQETVINQAEQHEHLVYG